MRMLIYPLVFSDSFVSIIVQKDWRTSDPLHPTIWCPRDGLLAVSRDTRAEALPYYFIGHLVIKFLIEHFWRLPDTAHWALSQKMSTVKRLSVQHRVLSKGMKAFPFMNLETLIIDDLPGGTITLSHVAPTRLDPGPRREPWTNAGRFNGAYSVEHQLLSVQAGDLDEMVIDYVIPIYTRRDKWNSDFLDIIDTVTMAGTDVYYRGFCHVDLRDYDRNGKHGPFMFVLIDHNARKVIARHWWHVERTWSDDEKLVTQSGCLTIGPCELCREGQALKTSGAHEYFYYDPEAATG
ncbi:hypothetical protein PMZ80_006265 [Knufia obscura]|uniref:Uncharacterized protein n=1 Tax=Knufia obscura TaxID=1635080 RepID=A0ABR0RL95_9EURO|nr:hypothetical protein PMZ80_006265 [Knufia obscura]